MIKSVLMASATTLVLLLAGPAFAQGASMSEMPAAAAAPTRAAPSLSYNVGMGPINLRPGSYISNTGTSAPANGADTTTGRKSFPVEKPNSAAAYNQNLINSRLQAQRISNSVIPSPFPPGF